MKLKICVGHAGSDHTQIYAKPVKILLTYTKPKSILEVGTAIGFSALLMSEYAPADCHITTIENMKTNPHSQRKF